MAARPQLPVLVVENDLIAPIGMLDGWLRAAGAELVMCSPATGQPLPADLGGYSALVVLGGGMGAYDDERAAWLPQLRQLLAEAVRTELPTLGVCLGAQLLAAATGGRVRPADTPEYGSQLVAKRQAAAADPLLREVPITPDVLQWHVDEISELPPGAVLLASSPVCEVQAFRIGRLAWGLQFHIETTPEIVALWAEHDAELLQDYDLPAILERSARAHPDIVEVWQPVVAAFVGLAADPAAAGPPAGAGPRLLPMAGAGSVTTTAGPITDAAAIRAALAAELQASREPPGH
ncbi:MAG TPA: type 1 glutamine amidotransferase [Jatrophihabitans sp.]|jgi:GMP synthase-like glutamine amidotransferase|uniref:type 1 glutamine amidotransferase n=1 Tax=Jatrophihabitans sp. TaxID=1932789 RepID=UPI002F1439B3